MISSIFLVMALQQHSLAPSVQSVTTASDDVAAARQRAHRVVPGETLSGIAPAMGESWPQLYAGNQSVIGGNPNLIYVGEVLHAGPGTRTAATRTSAARPESRGKTGSLRYGHPNYCGDGDGDGWDVPCPTAAKPTPVQRPAPSLTQPAHQAAAVRFTGSGTLTAAQVGQLWLNAGGPAWAEAHAEEIAFCESGYNPRAYNSSGATGIWQILGSVVPGNLTNPVVNAANAVAKFRASGNTFAQWVCR